METSFLNTAVHDGLLNSKFKIEWAMQHINQLKSLIDEIASEDPVWTEVDAKTGEHIVYVGIKPRARITISLGIGDIVHNLNTSLDYIWSGLARHIDPSLISKVTFPRHETRENLEDLLRKGPVHKAFPEVGPIILDRVKPYKDGNGVIWRLNKTDNACKHRMPIIAGTFHGIENIIITTDQGGRVSMSNSIIQTNSPAALVCGPSPFHIQDQSKTTTKVIFGKNEWFSGQPVLETLVNLTQAVSQVQNAFVETFIPEHIPTNQ